MIFHNRCEKCVYLKTDDSGNEICGLVNGKVPKELGMKWLYGVVWRFPCNTHVKYKLSCLTCKHFNKDDKVCTLTGCSVSEREPFSYATHCFAHAYDISDKKCVDCKYMYYYFKVSQDEAINSDDKILNNICEQRERKAFCDRKSETVCDEDGACQIFEPRNSFYDRDKPFERDCMECRFCDVSNLMWCSKFNTTMVNRETNRLVNDCIFFKGFDSREALDKKENKKD